MSAYIQALIPPPDLALGAKTHFLSHSETSPGLEVISSPMKVEQSCWYDYDATSRGRKRTRAARVQKRARRLERAYRDLQREATAEFLMHANRVFFEKCRKSLNVKKRFGLGCWLVLRGYGRGEGVRHTGAEVNATGGLHASNGGGVWG